MTSKTDKIFRVRNKKTGEFFKRRSKTAWHRAADAKNAWNTVYGGSYYDANGNYCRKPLFNAQDEWEVVEIISATASEIEALQEKVETYEWLLHLIQLHAEVSGNNAAVGKLISNICEWSYAHRCGNGTLTAEEQAALVREKFQKLCVYEDPAP